MVGINRDGLSDQEFEEAAALARHLLTNALGTEFLFTCLHLAERRMLSRRQLEALRRGKKQGKYYSLEGPITPDQRLHRRLRGKGRRKNPITLPTIKTGATP